MAAERAHDAVADVLVRRGHVLLYRLYDVGEAVALDAARTLLGLRADQTSRLAARPIRGLVVAKPPLVTDLGPVKVELTGGGALSGTAQARIFDFGVVSVQLRLAIPEGTPWATLVRWSSELEASRAVFEISDRYADQVAARIAETIEDPRRSATVEDYGIFHVQATDPPLKADELRARADVPALLLGDIEPGKLHASEQRAIQAYSMSYSEDDLTVIDWNAALVVMPAEESDIPDILEFATAQLLELRVYDELLDRELDRLYDRVGEKRGAIGRRMLAVRHPYRELARNAMLLLLDVQDVTEKSENALKVVGDPFLAKLYLTAIEAFGLPRWRAALDRKLATLDRIVSLLNDQADASRATGLELVVVILILLEIVLILALGK